MQCPFCFRGRGWVPSPGASHVLQGCRCATTSGRAEASPLLPDALWLPPLGCSIGALVGGGRGCGRRRLLG